MKKIITNFSELISIIVPVYNVEHFLVQCVQSILNQTYPNIEIILIDDGSTDKSGLLCDELSNSNNKIRVFHKTNGGLSSARNEGIKRSSSDYIIFVDSDDMVEKDMCLKLARAMVLNDSDIVVGSLIVCKDNLELYKEPLVSLDELTLYGQDNLDLILKGKNYSACGKLYKKKLFNDVKFPEGKLDEDYAIMYKLMMSAKSVTYIPEYVYFYTFRQGSITKSNFSLKKMDFIENAKNVYDDLKDSSYIKKKYKIMAKSFYLKRCNWYITEIYLAKDKQFKKILNHLRYLLFKNYFLIILGNYFSIKEKIVMSLNILSPRIYSKRRNNN